MNKANCLLAGLTAVVAAAGLLTLGSDSAISAQAQFNPEPLDCACSKGVDIGSPKAPVILKSCTSVASSSARSCLPRGNCNAADCFCRDQRSRTAQ